MGGRSAAMRGRGHHRRIAALLALALLAGALPAFAGTLYRCDAADGTRSYVSKRVPSATCKAISYSGTAAAPRATAPTAAAGSATTPNKVSETPVSTTAPAATIQATPTPAQPYRAPRLVQGQ